MVARMDHSPDPQIRRSRRSNVLLAATLEVGGAVTKVRLRNLSEDGALVDGDLLPEAGAEVVFRRNELVQRGRIAWVHGKHAGVAFDSPLKPQDVLRHVPPAGPKPEPKFWRPGIATRPLTAAEKKQVESWS